MIEVRQLFLIFIGKHGLDSSNIFFQESKLCRVFKSANTVLKAQLKKTFAQFGIFLQKIFNRKRAQFFCFHIELLLLMTVVGKGNLKLANLNASMANSSGIPFISYKILPGRIVATQYSGDPFPLPMRVSAGFLVIGLSGNMRIHS